MKKRIVLVTWIDVAKALRQNLNKTYLGFKVLGEVVLLYYEV
jgi:lipid-A-disaccharide synthase-like uncharacterized protein